MGKRLLGCARTFGLGLLALFLLADVCHACPYCVRTGFLKYYPEVRFWTWLLQAWSLALIIEWRLVESEAPEARLRGFTRGYLIGLVWGSLAPFAAIFAILWEHLLCGDRKQVRLDAAATVLMFLASFAGFVASLYPFPAHLLFVAIPAIPGLVLLSVYFGRTRGKNSGPVWLAALLALCVVSPLLGDALYTASNAVFRLPYGRAFAPYWPGDREALTILWIGLHITAFLPLVSGLALRFLDKDESRRKVKRRVLILSCVVSAALLAVRVIVEFKR